MARKIVETIYGKTSKFEIVKDAGTFGTSFYILKDGKAFKGSFSSLASAVEEAKRH